MVEDARDDAVFAAASDCVAAATRSLKVVRITGSGGEFCEGTANPHEREGVW